MLPHPSLREWTKMALEREVSGKRFKEGFIWRNDRVLGYKISLPVSHDPGYIGIRVGVLTDQIYLPTAIFLEPSENKHM